MGLLDDLKYITGLGDQDDDSEEREAEGSNDPECQSCGGFGLPDAFCPGCGKWDCRTDDEVDDGITIDGEQVI